MESLIFLCLLGFTLSTPVHDGLRCPTVAHIAITGTTKFPNVSGYLILTQESPDGPVSIQGDIQCLTPGLHGFHFHQTGNTSADCSTAGPHFNPFNKQHGAPTDQNRHVGDLGNVEALPTFEDEKIGVAFVNIYDDLISLCGERSVIGRALVIHAGTDDLGRGGNEESLKTGNAGARAGCGVVMA